MRLAACAPNYLGELACSIARLCFDLSCALPGVAAAHTGHVVLD
jgi:hypothetical protein